MVGISKHLPMPAGLYYNAWCGPNYDNDNVKRIVGLEIRAWYIDILNRKKIILTKHTSMLLVPVLRVNFDFTLLYYIQQRGSIQHKIESPIMTPAKPNVPNQ